MKKGIISNNEKLRMNNEIRKLNTNSKLRVSKDYFIL